MATGFTSYNVAPNPDDSTFGIMPVGAVAMWTTSTAPSGYLFCDGSAVSRNIYAHLFGVIGTTYGVGDNATTFNLPNMQGRVVRGVGTAPYTLAATGGADERTLAANQIPEHSHDVSDSGHDHAAVGLGLGYAATDGGNGNRASVANTATGFADIRSTDSLLVAGVPQTPQVAVETFDPFLTLNFIIKT